MSTPATRQTFLVYAPDKTEEGTLEKRLSVRPQHLATAKDNFASGLNRVGGALLSPESNPDSTAPKKMVGSAFICQADSIDKVWEMVKTDVYYTSGVWDPEKIVVAPYFIATPFNL